MIWQSRDLAGLCRPWGHGLAEIMQGCAGVGGHGLAEIVNVCGSPALRAHPTVWGSTALVEQRSKVRGSEIPLSRLEHGPMGCG
jgi:hypothetical protein